MAIPAAAPLSPVARPLARVLALPSRPPALRGRPTVAGKFLQAGGERLWVRGVTYGTFRPNAEGKMFPDPQVVGRDFAAMAAHGINAVRVYKLPPRWLLDLAEAHHIRVLAGFDWTQHVAFLESRKLAREIEAEVREGARALAGHPALLACSIGNEIPGPVARWHGRRRIERFVRGLYEEVKAADPEGLVTYVSYPTTEYLELPFLDLAAFNVYLESRDAYTAYLARLQNLVGERPLLMTELGLDALRNGEQRQAEVLDWQVRATFDAGCAGAFVFSWTSEWYCGGMEMLDWDFGLTTRERRPKPALHAVERAYAVVPPHPDPDWPRISVVVCSYNGSATIGETLEGLSRLEYPDYEVIVVDDGSLDETPEIAGRFPEVRLLSLGQNQGLSAARNAGMAAATGEIVAYIDDDAYPDPHWLTFLALAFREGDWAGVGGPNLLPPGDGDVSECVANAPGGPTHVLLTDQEAEHLPGCNMAFRKHWLEAVGGFDPRFRTAGDDVDLCWSLRERGARLGFHPSAVVFHHRRSSFARYWKQQVGYGRAEALLAGKWPQKHNSAGHIPWRGRIYGGGVTLSLRARPPRIYHGTWGSAAYQSVYEPAQGRLAALPLLPEWYLLILALAGLTALGALWPSLLFAAPALALAVTAVVAQAGRSAARARLRFRPRARRSRWWLRARIGLLHLLQPAARLTGRLRHGLTPWRPNGLSSWILPRARRAAIWSERWRPHEAWLEALESALRSRTRVRRGGEFDRFDLVVAGGALGSARTLMAVEEHGQGRQYVRFRVWPDLRRALPITAVAGALAAAAFRDGAWIAGAGFAAAALAPALAVLRDCGFAQGEILDAVRAVAAAHADATLLRDG